MTENSLKFREAKSEDLVALVGLLANDALGSGREIPTNPLPQAYIQAFEAITADANNHLLVAESVEKEVVGLLQLTFIPSLTYGGRTRAQIEGVRVHASMRGQGLGRQMMEEAIERAREQGCCMVQLTTDKRRPKALSFYESLGFVGSHEGMKLHF